MACVETSRKTGCRSEEAVFKGRQESGGLSHPPPPDSTCSVVSSCKM